MSKAIIVAKQERAANRLRYVMLHDDGTAEYGDLAEAGLPANATQGLTTALNALMAAKGKPGGADGKKP